MSEPLDPDAALQQSISRHVRAGLLVSAVLCFGIIGWSASAQLAGAVVTQGQVVVETSAKKVQHPSGGVVRAINIREGSRVKAGDVLVVLDDTQPRANLAVVAQSLDELTGRRARLEAERDGAGAIDFPAALLDRAEREPEVAKILSGEKRLFEARLAARTGQKEQLLQRVKQLTDETEGLSAQQTAKADEIVLIRKELEDIEVLFKRKLVPMTRVNALRRDATRIEGERGRLVSAIAEAKGRIAEIELQIIQVDQELRTEVLRDLREVDGKMEEMRQRHVAAADQLARIEIRAPQSGVVNQLSIHTVGGVIGAGETLMQVIPERDRLVVDAKVAPQDVDQLSIGQSAVVRLSAFNQRTTPEVFGRVINVSADLVRDEQPSPTGQQAYFSARIVLDDPSLAQIKHVKLLPGMPVEVHVQTESRSALSYFVRPLTDQFNRAFREQ